MALNIVSLPAMTQTTSAVDVSTGSVPSWDVSDAISVTFSAQSATTAPGPSVWIAYTSESTATFYKLSYYTSGASAVFTSSGVATTIPVISFKQMRVQSSTIMAANGVHVGSKLIQV